MREVFVPIGEITRFDNGVEVVVVEHNPLPKVANPSEKAIHEAHHIAADPSAVESASVISTAEYDAVTHLNRYSRKAFGASEHLSGNGHDMNVLRANGDDPAQAGMEARIALAGKEEHIHAVASALDMELNISGNRAREIMDRVENGGVASIQIKTPDGKITTEKRRGVKSREVPISGDLVQDQWLDLAA